MLIAATSIAPAEDPEPQMRAMAAWLDAGATVHSLNDPVEIDLLAPLHPAVRFVPVAQTGLRSFGARLVRLRDLIGHVRSLGVPVVAIANSDVILHDFDLPEAVRLARTAAIAGVRADVCDLGDSEAWTAPGFDFFLMPAAMLEQTERQDFHLGLPYWDYWMPAMLLLRGNRVLITDPPAARHRVHDNRWLRNTMAASGIFTAAMLEEMERGRDADLPINARADWLAVDILRSYQQALLHRVYGVTRPEDEADRMAADRSAREFGDLFAAATRGFIDRAAERIDLSLRHG